jgi:ABC-type branched-subunit amino acid transport system permease subunit
MNAYIPYIVTGLIVGSIYGLSAMGLVLTYKTSGLFNVGHGAVCAASAFVFYELRQEHGMAWPLAAVLTVAVFGAATGLVLERLAGALSGVTTTYKIVATVGLLVAVRSIVILIWGSEQLTFEPFLPQDQAFQVSNVSVSWDNVIDMAIGVAAAAGLSIFFRTARLGVAMRGVVDNPALLDMAGTAPAKVRRTAWIIGSMFAAISGVLFASVTFQLDVNVLSLLVVQAFGAAAIGRFQSIPMAFVGGLLVGLLQKLISKEFAGEEIFRGIDLNVPFIVLFLAMLVTPKGRLQEIGRKVKDRAPRPSPFSVRTRTAGYTLLLVGALLVPNLVDTRLSLYSTGLTQVILFLSLGLLVRTSGQISLCHVGFAAIGAAGFGHRLAGGVPWGLALLLGGVFAVPVGAFIAIPAIRLSGLFLGLATLGFGILLAQYAYGQSWMFGFGRLDTRRPDFAGLEDDKRYYYFLLAIALVCIAVVVGVERSRLGRLLRRLADSPTALTSLGTNLNMIRVMVFCLSAFLAGISGAMYASLFGSVNQDSFNYLQSLVLLAVLAISGRGTVTSAVIGAALLYIVPGYIDDPDHLSLLQVGFGLSAILAACLSQGQLASWTGRFAAAGKDRTLSPWRDRVDPVHELRPELLVSSAQTTARSLTTSGVPR